MTPPQLQLPTIRVSDIEILADWDFENVKAIGDSIPGFRSSSSASAPLFRLLIDHIVDEYSFPDNPPV